MNDKFDELAQGMAQSTRRGALKKFAVGLAGIGLASFGLANQSQASKSQYRCHCGTPYAGCAKKYTPGTPDFDACWSYCQVVCGN